MALTDKEIAADVLRAKRARKLCRMGEAVIYLMAAILPVVWMVGLHMDQVREEQAVTAVKAAQVQSACQNTK